MSNVQAQISKVANTDNAELIDIIFSLVSQSGISFSNSSDRELRSAINEALLEWNDAVQDLGFAEAKKALI